MPKVYFRTADSKAISKDIEGEVNYEKALESIHKKFKLPKEHIKLVYNGQTYTGNFKLNDSIPHHIVHVINKAGIGNDEITVSLTVNNGKGARKIQNIKTRSNVTTKDFIKEVFQTANLNNQKTAPESAEIYHCGVKLSDDETFLDKGIEDNANLNILLKDGYLDPADVPLVTQELNNLVSPIVMSLQLLPKYFTIATQLNVVKNSGFFHAVQQKYEGLRPNLLFQDYGPYQWPEVPGDDNAATNEAPEE